MTKHTPGPWVPEEGGGRGSWIRNPETGKWSALALGDDDITAEANARLIAAAPELLEALREVTREYIENNLMWQGYPPDGDAIARATEAISKAEGSDE